MSTYMQLIDPILLHELLLDVEDLPDGPGDDAALVGVLLDAWAALHGVGLARAGLPVGEHADVVAVEGGLDQLRDLPVHVILAGRGPEHSEVRE